MEAAQQLFKKKKQLSNSQLSDGKGSVCDIPSDAFLVSSCWPNQREQSKSDMKMSGRKQRDQRSRGDRCCLSQEENGPLPAVMPSLAPTGQTRGFGPPPCLHRLSLRRLRHRAWQLQTGLLASWPLLQQSEPINTNYTPIIIHT